MAQGSRVVDPKDLMPYQAPQDLTGAPQSSRKPQDPDPVKPNLEHLNRMLEELGYGVRYGLYKGTEEFYATVTDLRTGKVVRQIPSEELLELHRRLFEMVGAFLDERA